MKRLLLFIFICTSTTICLAQNSRLDIDKMAGFTYEGFSSKVVSNSSISIGIIPAIEFSYEDALSDKTSLIFRAGLPSHMRWTMLKEMNGSSEYSGEYDAAFGLTLEPRYYFGLTERSRRGKNTFLNSSNYVSVINSICMDHKGRTDLRAVPVVGMRRVIGSGWMFELYGGAGVGLENMDRLYLCPSLQFRIGYCFKTISFRSRRGGYYYYSESGFTY